MRGVTRAQWAVCVMSVAAVGLGAAGCGGGDGAAGVVRASWGDPQNQLEPANTNEVQGGKVLGMIFRGLKRYDPRSGAAEYMLAEKIDSTDQQTFTVTLKDGWTFSNGEKVTSKSFVDAWNYAALLDNKQKNAPFFESIEGYDKVHPAGGSPSAKTLSGLTVKDEKTFTVRLRTKFSTWPDTLGYSAYSPLPRAFFDDHAGWLKKPVGNGPYVIDSYVKGSSMRLTRWNGYPGEDKARNSGVELRVYTDNNTAYTDLQAGNLDLVDDIPAAQLKNVKRDLGDRYINQPAGILQTLEFPMYDAAAAKKLIEDGGGLPGGRVTLTSNVDSGSHRVWMDAVCNSINNALGKDKACTVNPVGTFADFRNQISAQRMTGPFRSGWQMDYPLIQNFLQPLYYSDASSNYGKFSDPRFDKLVDEANAESSQDKANAKFQDAEKILAVQMPAIPLWYQNGSAGYGESLSDVTLNPFSVPVYEQIKVG
jgi:oligopeptide transport system substrate-binding protein